MADNYQVLNGAGTTINISAKEEAANLFSTRVTPRHNGADVSSANPLPVDAQSSELTAINTKTPALGTAVRANSTPVNLATDHPAIQVNLTAATVGWQGPDSTRLQTIADRTPALGAAVRAASTPVTLASDQPAIAVSLAGVATAVKQPNFGTAGSPSADVLSIQGIAGGTPLPVTVTSASAVNVQTFTNMATASPVATNVIRNSAGALHGYMVSNSSGSMLFLKFYNNPATPGQNTSPLLAIGIPAGGAANIAFPTPIAFNAGISFRVDTAAPQNSPLHSTPADFVVSVLHSA